MHAARPKITVCIPTYNYAAYLPEAIDSVLGQSLVDFEILIIDDCSRDGTREVLGGYARKDPRIDFRVNPRNLGMVDNWNLCLREARGEYVKFVFGDDFLSSPDALRRMSGILDAEPSVSLVASARNIVDAETHILDVWSDFPDGYRGEGTGVINRCLRTQRNLIGEPTAVMFRKSQSERGFDRRYRQIVDLEMWFHLLEQGRFAFLGEPLCGFRLHPEQQTRVNASRRAMFADEVFLFEDYTGNPAKGYIDFSPFERSYLRYELRYRYWKEARRGGIDRRTALREIGAHGSLPGFFLRLPLHKLHKEYRRFLRRRAERRS